MFELSKEFTKMLLKETFEIVKKMQFVAFEACAENDRCSECKATRGNGKCVLQALIDTKESYDKAMKDVDEKAE